MNYTLEQKYDLIKIEVVKNVSTNPIEIVKSIMHNDFVSVHGPEHHYLDGAAFLVAYNNAGGCVDLDAALAELANRTTKMPGAMCGQWGICGSTAAIGAALSILHKTGPLSDDDFYKQHMQFTSTVIAEMSKLGGPRCCKRNAFLSLGHAAKFVKEHYGVNIGISDPECEFTDFNSQCIKTRCPFFKN